MLTTERKACPPNDYIGVYCLKNWERFRKTDKSWTVEILRYLFWFRGNVDLKMENCLFFRFIQLCSVSNALLDLLAYKPRTIYVKTRSHWCLGSLTFLLLFFINFYNLHIIIYTQFCCLPYYLCSSTYTTDKRGGKIVTTPRRCRTKEQFLT